MEAKSKKHKLFSAVTAVVVAAVILLTGTFAWQSISQKALNETMNTVNPGGRLHDDFDGENKDVYVENFGDTPILARVRLDEYMEIGNGAGLKTGAEGYEEKEATSLVPGADINNVNSWKTHIPGDTINAARDDDPFHEYWEWEFGGSTVYMPTFNKNKDSLEADINGTFVGKDGDPAIGKPYDDYEKYTVGQQITADAVYDNDENTIDEGEAATEENIRTESETHTAANTLSGTVMTMQQWLDAGAKSGPYWVYDTDGWAYWAQAIEPESATGLLLTGIDMVEDPGEDWYYGINVVGQFATLDDWGSEAGNDGFFGDDAGAPPTDNAEILLNGIKGLKVTVSADGDATAVEPGKTLQFSAEVFAGEVKYPNQEVTWSISGQTSDSTSIDPSSGLLTVGADEDVFGTLTIKATSAANGTSTGTYRVSVPFPENITPGSTQTVNIDGYAWYVLAEEDSKVLLFAKDTVGPNRQLINQFAAGVGWDECDIRDYLNNTLLDTLPNLKSRSIETELSTRFLDEDRWITTKERLFLLTECDINGKYGTEETSNPQDYTYGNSIIVPEELRAFSGADAWLRTCSNRAKGYSIITSSGTVSNGGTATIVRGIRPALWIDITQ